MKISDVSKNSTVILTGTIIPSKMEMIKRIFLNNSSIYSQFKNIILNINCMSQKDWEYGIEYEKLLIDTLDGNVQIYLLRDYINRGWQFGTMDLEKTAYSFYKQNLLNGGVLKLDFDIYLTNHFLELNIDDVDVLVMPSIGYATVEKGSSFVIKEFESNKWNILYPQSTIYFIHKQLDYLYTNQDWLNEKYKLWILNPIGNGPHHIGVACEPLLRQSFERNDCKMKSMITADSFKKLIETIQIYKMHDPSHKNILFSDVGVCHLFDDSVEVITI